MKITCGFLLVCILLYFNSKTFGYDNEKVHQLINKNAALQSANLISSLQALGFSGTLPKEVLELNFLYNKNINDWLIVGAKLEDETHCRSRNHFHDPLKEWNQAGLNNAAINILCSATGNEPFSVDSSLVWAQKKESANSWSWSRARNSYYKALTSESEEEREKNFADTFRALGQVMHLIADSSVPAHVRNDIHVFPFTIPFSSVEVGRQTYESWARKNFQQLPYTGIKKQQSLFAEADLDISAPVRISALWDQNKYNGADPCVTWSTKPAFTEIGIAEFTNANFFSEDTIFKDYPHPTEEHTSIRLIEQHARDGKKDKVWYLKGYTSQKLAALSYLWKFRNFIPKKEWLYNLDGYVYTEYASQLIPRATGYSSAMLDYFFRGDIDICSMAADHTKYVIVNKTDEKMEGIFELWYDDREHHRKRIWSEQLSIQEQGQSTDTSFPIPTDNAREGQYLLVFKGSMGFEENAVTAKSVVLDQIYLVRKMEVITPLFEITIQDTAGRHAHFDLKTVQGFQELYEEKYDYEIPYPLHYGIAGAHNHFDSYYAGDLWIPWLIPSETYAMHQPRIIARFDALDANRIVVAVTWEEYFEYPVFSDSSNSYEEQFSPWAFGLLDYWKLASVTLGSPIYPPAGDYISVKKHIDYHQFFLSEEDYADDAGNFFTLQYGGILKSDPGEVTLESAHYDYVHAPEPVHGSTLKHVRPPIWDEDRLFPSTNSFLIRNIHLKDFFVSGSSIKPLKEYYEMEYEETGEWSAPILEPATENTYVAFLFTGDLRLRNYVRFNNQTIYGFRLDFSMVEKPDIAEPQKTLGYITLLDKETSGIPVTALKILNQEEFLVSTLDHFKINIIPRYGKPLQSSYLFTEYTPQKNYGSKAEFGNVLYKIGNETVYQPDAAFYTNGAREYTIRKFLNEPRIISLLREYPGRSLSIFPKYSIDMEVALISTEFGTHIDNEEPSAGFIASPYRAGDQLLIGLVNGQTPDPTSVYIDPSLWYAAYMYLGTHYAENNISWSDVSRFSLYEGGNYDEDVTVVYIPDHSPGKRVRLPLPGYHAEETAILRENQPPGHL